MSKKTHLLVLLLVIAGAGCIGGLGGDATSPAAGPGGNATSPAAGPGGNATSPAADGVVHMGELPGEAQEEFEGALATGSYQNSTLAFRDAVNTSKVFVVRHNGSQYFPAIRNYTHEGERSFRLTPRRVYNLSEIPADVRREIRTAIDAEAYENTTLAYNDWTDDEFDDTELTAHPVIADDGALYRVCVLASQNDYQLLVERAESIQSDPVSYC